VPGDAQRFVVVTGSVQMLTSPFTVVVNWPATLKAMTGSICQSTGK
jgi:hypothetical protein